VARLALLVAAVWAAGCATAPTLVHAQSGATSTLAELQGRPLVITFWAEWCKPCLTQQPVLAEVAREVSPDILVIPVYFRPRPDDGLVGWMRDQPADFTGAVCWANWPFLRKFDLTAIPKTFIFGRNGKQIEELKGMLTEEQLPIYRGALLRAMATPFQPAGT
jgi:thiol-disulfide isomerase/thioredoxin